MCTATFTDMVGRPAQRRSRDGRQPLAADVGTGAGGDGQAEVGSQEEHPPRADTTFDERADGEHHRQHAQALGPQRR